MHLGRSTIGSYRGGIREYPRDSFDYGNKVLAAMTEAGAGEKVRVCPSLASLVAERFQWIDPRSPPSRNRR